MNPTIFRLATKALFARRRVLLLGAAPALLIVLAVVVRAFGSSGGQSGVVSNLGFRLLLPLVALVAANSVIGPEIEDGSVVYLLATPISRYAVGTSKFVAALGATWLLGALPLLVAGLIIDPSRPGRALAWFIAGLVSGTTYTAVFLALGAWLRHAVVVGLAFVVVWEGLLGRLLPGVRWVNIGAWGQQVASAVSSLVSSPGLTLVYAVLAAALVVVAAVWFTGDRLRSFSLRGDVGA